MSDIFNEFAKIAIEKGLIKEAKVGDETNQRFDSLSNDDIKALYGIEPNGKEEHILDQAHPESAYVSPAYDKMNGLVENLFERQDVMQWIATKPNDGKHTNERYVKASQDLTMALLNTAFMLDKTGDEELMKLADSCANRLTKVGFAPWMAYVAVSGLASMGIINNFGGMIDNGVLSNSDRTIKELKDLISDNELPGKEEDIQNLISDIQHVKMLNEELRALNIDSEDEAGLKSEIKEGETLLKNYITKVRRLDRRIANMLSLAEVAGEQRAGSSWMAENLGDFGISLEKTWEVLWGNDIKDALVAMDTLRDSLSKSISSMSKLFHVVKAKAQNGEHEALADLLNIKVKEPEETSELEEALKLAAIGKEVPWTNPIS